VQWATCAAAWVVLAAVWLLPHLDLPLRAVGPFGLAAAICRTLVAATSHVAGGAPRSMRGTSLAADALLLTGLLDITGGPFNPFIVMYAVYIWLGVATTSMRWTAAVTAASAAGFGWLVVDHLQAGGLEHHRLNDFPTHLFTMWYTGAAVAELVAHYVTRARATLAQRQQLLEEARDRAARSERLASLTTLAAGAAHELSTPLGTIAVAARELERSASRLAESGPMLAAIKDDARLIRTEVDRCHVILDGMSGRAGDGLPGGDRGLAPQEIAALARGRLADGQQRRLRVEIAPDTAAPRADGAEVVQALSSLLKNAFDAGGPDDDVLLRLAPHGRMLRIEVHDRGDGMTADARRRAGEPSSPPHESDQ